MASEVLVVIGLTQPDRVIVEGNTVAEALRAVLAIYPRFAQEINNNNPEYLVARSRGVYLNDETVFVSYAATFETAEPLIPLPDWVPGLNVPVKTGDTIRIHQLLAG